MIRSLAIALMLAATLGACGKDMSTDGGRPSRAQQTLDGLRTGYLAANLAIAGYAFLKPCGDGVQAPCSDLNVLAQLRTGSALVGSALIAAQASINAPDGATNLERVNAALLALTQMLVDYRLK